MPRRQAAILLPKDSLKEIRLEYVPCDYLIYAERLANADVTNFPSFVLSRRLWYASRLKAMAKDPSSLRHIQAINALKLLGRTNNAVS